MISFEKNEVTRKLPEHLFPFIVGQHYERYTPEQQAVWRYVMRLNVHKLKDRAHESYLEGLEMTGISIDSIPHMHGMNRILKKIGWAAVSVDGFIPPSSFMEFQAYNVLVIASEMRSLENIGYTPAPDIIHEAAGHAPIIANSEYAEYLRRFGEIGSRAIASKHDKDVYEAVRLLSILKETPQSTEIEIQQAEQKVLELQSKKVPLSELAMIRNLHWWTVEYGLIGELDQAKIYGAGLLSSIAESEYALSDEVKKIPYTLEAAQQGFDITKPQPQLFVTPDFAHLSFVLEQFADTMALRRGGIGGIHKLIESDQTGTLELSTGLQISGVFNNCIEKDSKPIYIQSTGPTALAYRDKELIGHGTIYHKDGFGSPLGKLKNFNLAIEDMSPKDLEIYGIYEGKEVELEFEGDIVVKGRIVTGTRNLQGKIMLISFEDCTVKHGDEILFDPAWGRYDMAVGKEVISAYGGPADALSFDFPDEVSETKSIKAEYQKEDYLKFEFYEAIRALREGKSKGNKKDLIDLIHRFLAFEGKTWLMALELQELCILNQYEDQELNNILSEYSNSDNYGTWVKQGLELLASEKVS
jgi:phenylalanine-4-hydroxylase